MLCNLSQRNGGDPRAGGWSEQGSSDQDSARGPPASLGPSAFHNITFLSTGPDSRARQKLWPRNWLEGWGGGYLSVRVSLRT